MSDCTNKVYLLSLVDTVSFIKMVGVGIKVIQPSVSEKKKYHLVQKFLLFFRVHIRSKYLLYIVKN